MSAKPGSRQGESAEIGMLSKTILRDAATALLHFEQRAKGYPETRLEGVTGEGHYLAAAEAMLKGIGYCGLCGGYGAMNGVTNKPVPCMACGKESDGLVLTFREPNQGGTYAADPIEQRGGLRLIKGGGT